MLQERELLFCFDSALHLSPVTVVHLVLRYGSEGDPLMPEGLHVRRMDELIDFIADQGFNSIRLFFNLEDWNSNPLVPQQHFSPQLNPELIGLTYHKMFRVVIQKAAQRQLLVLLTCHRLRRSYANADHSDAWPGYWNGLWWEEINGLEEHTLAGAWWSIADMFCNEWNFFAVDLFNEPHGGFWGRCSIHSSRVSMFTP